MIMKKSGSWWRCVDYWALSNITIKDSYPLPRMNDTFDALVRAKWFSMLDLKYGYHQVKMADADRAKTTFSYGQGL